MTDRGIVVIGGGIVGASVAYHLGRRTSNSVTLYERGDLASETTAKSTAMIGVSGPAPFHRMQEYGFRLYNDFFADPVADTRYREAGRLRVATEPDAAKTLQDLAAPPEGRANDHVGKKVAGGKYANSLVDYVDGDVLRDRFLLPPLDTEVVEGALYRPQYGYVQCDRKTLGAQELAREFTERAREVGVTIETNTDVTDVIVEGSHVVGIETEETETIEADIVVAAAGPWNRRLAELAGLDLPLELRRSPVLSLELDEPLDYSLPMIKSHESSVGIHPKRRDRILVTYSPHASKIGKSADRAAAIDDPSGIDDPVPGEHRKIALSWAKRLLPMLAEATVTDEWVGIGTDTPDGNPIVGWSEIEGFSLAATPTGIQYAPAVGDIVARQLVDSEPTEYYDAVSISRFDGYEDRR